MQNSKNQYIIEKKDDILVDFEALKSNQFVALILYEILNSFGFSAAIVKNILTHPYVGNYYFSDNYKLLLARKYLVISKKNKEKELVNKTYLVQNESVLKTLGFSIELHEYSSTLLFEKESHIFYADADKLRFPLTIRHWKEGDYFYPFGMKGKKKMSDWFIDNKIDRNRKENVELLCCGENIAWVVGFRSDDRYKIDEQTRHYYKIIKQLK
jgi:tRNA(Ile)-lysidine synthase